MPAGKEIKSAALQQLLCSGPVDRAVHRAVPFGIVNNRAMWQSTVKTCNLAIHANVCRGWPILFYDLEPLTAFCGLLCACF